ncbi:MAG: transcriptional repressor [Bryobacteraceae bacterium]
MQIRKTKQRTAIRDAFERAGRPLAAEEVLSEAGKEAAGLGLATVYRGVKALVEEGWLVAVELPGEPPRYERSDKAHHHHFHCRGCGKMFEVEGCPPNLDRLVPSGFRLTGHEILMYGDCAACLKRKRR